MGAVMWMRRGREEEADVHEVAELAALADGSVAPERRAALEAQIAASPALADRLAEQEKAVALLRGAGDEVGTPDGLRIDEDGNLWCGWGGGEGLDGVRVFAPDSTPIGHIDLPERCANLAFGGRARNRLFLAAHTSLYALYVNVRGVR